MDGLQEISKARKVYIIARRNLASVLFPTLVAYSIYADWSRTQRFKEAKRKQIDNIEFS